jgi:hypothetical protein
MKMIINIMMNEKIFCPTPYGGGLQFIQEEKILSTQAPILSRPRK